MLRHLWNPHLQWLEKLPEDGESVFAQPTVHKKIVQIKYISYHLENIKAN